MQLKNQRDRKFLLRKPSAHIYSSTLLLILLWCMINSSNVSSKLIHEASKNEVIQKSAKIIDVLSKAKNGVYNTKEKKSLKDSSGSIEKSEKDKDSSIVEETAEDKNALPTENSKNLGNEQNTISRITNLETLVRSYHQDVKDELALMRNATLLLMLIAANKDHECQKMNAVKTKIKELQNILRPSEVELEPLTTEKLTTELPPTTITATEQERETEPTRETESVITTTTRVPETTIYFENETTELFTNNTNDSNTVATALNEPVTSVEPYENKTTTLPSIPLETIDSKLDTGDLVLEDPSGHKSWASHRILTTTSKPIKSKPTKAPVSSNHATTPKTMGRFNY